MFYKNIKHPICGDRHIENGWETVVLYCDVWFFRTNAVSSRTCRPYSESIRLSKSLRESKNTSRIVHFLRRSVYTHYCLYVRVYAVSIITINPIKPKSCFVEKLYKNNRELSCDYSVNLKYNLELRVEIPFSFPPVIKTRKISEKCNLLRCCIQFNAFSGRAQSCATHRSDNIFSDFSRQLSTYNKTAGTWLIERSKFPQATESENKFKNVFLNFFIWFHDCEGARNM